MTHAAHASCTPTHGGCAGRLAVPLADGWNNCTAEASRPHATPALALAHHKTGTYFALAAGGAFCRGRCCVRLLSPGDAVWPLRSVARPELVLSVFGHRVLVEPDARHYHRIVHFVRSPRQVVASALAYHMAGHEDHSLVLTLDEVANASWSIVAGIQGSVYCATETSSLDVVRLVRVGVALLGRSSTLRHAKLLRSLDAKQRLQFEAAWNWCELSHMLRIAEQLCAHAHAVQLDVSSGSDTTYPPHASGAGGGLALNLTGLARQLAPAGQFDSRVADARIILQSSLLSSHANRRGNGTLHDDEHSAFAGHDQELASVYARLEERYAALRGCTSWRWWRDG